MDTMRRRHVGWVLGGVVSLSGCNRPAKPAPGADAGASTRPAEVRPADAGPADAPLGRSGQHRAEAPWVPAEFKAGNSKWRDAAVYADGKALGFLHFGELPLSLEPIWVKSEESLDFGPGDKGPREAPVKERRYRIVDLLAAYGVDVGSIKELHLYGGKGVPMVVTAQQLKVHGKGLCFGFGGGTSGKPLMFSPAGLKTNTTFDQVRTIAVYATKKPPKVTAEDVLLDGKPVEDVPYFGEPLRGGIHVYKDDRLATVIKRHKLVPESPAAVKDGDKVRFKLLRFLEIQGVYGADLADAELIYDDRRLVRLSADELAQTTFAADAQQSGQVFVGKADQATESIALYTKDFRKKRPAKPLEEPAKAGKK